MVQCISKCLIWLIKNSVIYNADLVIILDMQVPFNASVYLVLLVFYIFGMYIG